MALAVACSVGRGQVEVSQVTANLALPSDTGAIYMRIENQTDSEERLIGASVPGCGVIELHEMAMEGDVMRMRPVEGGAIVIPAGEVVELAPGGLHVMCIDKTGEFAVGDTVPVNLQFAVAGEIQVGAEVVPPG
jgi:copper(I)-binding protein